MHFDRFVQNVLFCDWNNPHHVYGFNHDLRTFVLANHLIWAVSAVISFIARNDSNAD